MAHSVSSRRNADWRETEAPCVSAAGLSIFSSSLSTTPVKSSRTERCLRAVWRDVSVEESSLRFHIKNLRKALGDTQSGTRYVTNVPGRGYCFAAQVDRMERAANPRSGGVAD